MKDLEDKRSYNYTSAIDNHCSNAYNFEIQKGNPNDTSSKHRKMPLGTLTKPTPSKWDDAQKWLVGLSGARDHGPAKCKARNSDADDMRLLRAMSQKARNSCSSLDGGLEEGRTIGNTMHFSAPNRDEVETKKIDCGESAWRIDNPVVDSPLELSSFYVRDVGTEMTPIASQEPSRAATPLRELAPVLATPIDPRSSRPERCPQGAQALEGTRNMEGRNQREESADGCNIGRENDSAEVQNLSTLESRAMEWDEAERAKYMARYKREEMKIQAWENHEKRKAEMEMKKIEVKAERLKSRAQESLANKLAATRRIAEEKRANAEAKLNERAATTAEKSEYIRRTGQFSSPCFSFKFPSFCC